MLRQRRLFTIFTALLLLCTFCLTAYAYPALDLSRKGSIKITMPYGKTVEEGGSMALYRVGNVRESNGNYDFMLTGDFAGCGISLQDIQSAELAKKLSDYAAKSKLKGNTQKIAGDGTVEFKELEPGLYLLVQTKAAEGYNNAMPFLVSLPMLEKNEYVYDVQADPKVELTSPTVTTKPDRELTPTVAPEPGSSDTKLPQTGQLNWPIPVLAVLGLGMFSVGWLLRYGKRNDDEK